MQFIKNKEAMLSQDFDFLALSFAQMTYQGRQVDLDDVTGTMDEASKKWFLERYDFYLQKLDKAP